MKKVFFMFAVLACSACEYIPMTEFKIKTVDGSIVTFACPIIDAHRSKFTYLIDGKCVAVGVVE